MTRKEEIDRAWGGYEVRSNYRYDEKSFKEGAKWADKNPNLCNDEKYHTVKVSCLDELNRKAELYDKFVDKACEWLCRNTNKHIDDKYLTMSFNLTNEMINDFRKAMEE